VNVLLLATGCCHVLEKIMYGCHSSAALQPGSNLLSHLQSLF